MTFLHVGNHWVVELHDGTDYRLLDGTLQHRLRWPNGDTRLPWTRTTFVKVEHLDAVEQLKARCDG